MQMLTEAVSHIGRHAIVYGDRGIGKSSIANVMYEALRWPAQLNLMLVHVNCDSEDTFDSLWRKIFRELSVTDGNRVTSLQNKSLDVPRTLEQWLETKISPEDIRRLSSLVNSRLIIIIDEFDQLVGNVETARLMANTIKTLSDRRTPVTLVLVGVADNITELIAEHESVERNLVQIHVPRMSDTEIGQIVAKGLAPLGVTIAADDLRLICLMAHGLPAVAQLIGFHLASAAMENGRSSATWQDLRSAIAAAIDAMPEQQRRMNSELNSEATKILFSAALANADEFGWFDAGDAVDALLALDGATENKMGPCSQNLHSFATGQAVLLDRDKRGGCWRFRFRNASFQSYLIMSGILSGAIPRGILVRENDSGPCKAAGDVILDNLVEESLREVSGPTGQLPKPNDLYFSDVRASADTVAEHIAQVPVNHGTPTRPLGTSQKEQSQKLFGDGSAVSAANSLVGEVTAPNSDITQPTEVASEPGPFVARIHPPPIRQKKSPPPLGLFLIWQITLGWSVLGGLSTIPLVTVTIAAQVNRLLYSFSPQLSTESYYSYSYGAPFVGGALMVAGIPILALSFLHPDHKLVRYVLVVYCCCPVLILAVWLLLLSLSVA